MKKVEKKINFLSDKALRYDEINKDRFGHEGIAETIKTIVLKSTSPFTIGLFGKWGVGKTTIINITKKKLQEEKIPVVIFDIWKHEGDSLRRTFLKDIHKQLKEQKQLPANDKLDDRLDKPLSIKRDAGFDINKLKTKQSLFVLSAIIIIGIMIWIFLPQIFSSFITPFLTAGLILAILAWLLPQLVITEKITETIDRFKDPHEFEFEFKRMIDKVSARELVIIIDNLDRTSHEKAVKLLSTIKTFLEQENCIFLIACDDEAIKKHLRTLYADDIQISDSSGADEFLRKFFNAHVRIPDFIDTELQDYTEELLKETGVKKLVNPEVAYVITTAFRDNPRQIKQFINILLSHYLLAREREDKQNPLITPKGTMTNNIAFLSKLLVILQKFPKAYSEIKQKRLNSTEINEMDLKDPNLKEFLISTSSIPRRKIKSVRPFIYFKQSKEELRIPNVEDLELALVDNKQDIVNEEFKHILKSSELLREYERFTRSLMRQNKNRQIALLNIIQSSLTALEKNNLELNIEYYDEIARFLNTTLEDQLHILKPSLIFNQIIDRCDRQLILNISSQYAKILSSQSDEKTAFEVADEWNYELFKEFANHPGLLKRNKEDILKALSETFIPKLSEDDIKNKDTLSKKIKLIVDFENFITINVIEKLISRFSELFKVENQQPFSKEKENFLFRIKDIFDTYNELISEVDRKVLKNLGDSVMQGTNAIGDWNQKKIFIPICLKLKDILLDPQKANINTVIMNFWNNTNSESIEYVLSRFKYDARQKISDEYWAIFQEISVKQQDKFSVIWKFSPKVKQQDLFKAVINSNNYRWGLDKLKEVKYETGFKKETVSILLNRVKGLPIQHKSDFYQAINDMKCGYDVKLRESYVNQLKGLLNNAATSSQEVGYNALSKANYLSETHRRDITRNTIDWLRNLSPINHQYQYAIKSVILNWKILQPTPRNYYIDLIFEKLLKSSSDINDIKLSVEILQQIKPIYEDEDYKKYFDDILARLKTENREDIKIEIKIGLSKIRPSKLNKQNKKFWKELEEV